MAKNIKKLTHFILHVLPEANFVWVKAKFDQEELYTSHKVAYCLVVDGTVLNCFAEGGRRSISLTRELNVPVEEINLNVDNFMKTVVLLPAFRINVTVKGQHAKSLVCVGRTHCSISAIRNSRTRSNPALGEISLRPDLPIEADAKGIDC